MRRKLVKGVTEGVVWSAVTAQFAVELSLFRSSLPYDGDDFAYVEPKLESGQLCMLDAILQVTWLASNDTPAADVALGYSYFSALLCKPAKAWEFILTDDFRDGLKEACDDTREALARAPTLRH